MVHQTKKPENINPDNEPVIRNPRAIHYDHLGAGYKGPEVTETHHYGGKSRRPFPGAVTAEKLILTALDRVDRFRR